MARLAEKMGDRPFMDDMTKSMLLTQAGGLSARKVTAMVTQGPKKHYNLVYTATPAKYTIDDGWRIPPAQDPRKQEIPASATLRGSQN